MTTYNVRADGTQGTALSATGDISDPANAMTLATCIAALATNAFSSGDVIIVSSRGGIHTAGSNIAISVDNITFRGEDGYRPKINCGGSAVRVKVNNCYNSLLENFEIYGSIANGVEWTGTGTGHVVRDVHSHDNTGSGVAAFSNELTDSGATVTAYGLVGNNCTDDGWSSHAASITYLYGGNFYGNAQGINHVSTSALHFYDVKVFGNSEFDYGATGAGLDSTANFYDCEFGGAVIGADQTETTVTASFYRCKFHCNAVSTTAGFTTACIHFSKNETRTANIYMESCEFLEPTTHCLLCYGDASTFTAVKCSVNQGSKVGSGFWFPDNVAGETVFTITDCNFYNCINGILGSNNGTITNCNFDGCTVDINGSGNTESGNTSVSSGFEQAAVSDYRLASGSALIGAGTTLTVTHDVEGRPYSTNDIGCYADTTARPKVYGKRPTR